MAHRLKLQFQGNRLLQLACACALTGLAATLLSALTGPGPKRLITLGEGYFIDSSWLGWPVQYIYQTDLVQPSGTSIDQSVNGVLLASNWLVWTLGLFGLTLILMLGRYVYAYTRH